jgi:hypothetical protein
MLAAAVYRCGEVAQLEGFRRLKVDGERVEGDEGGFSLRKRAEKSM